MSSLRAWLVSGTFAAGLSAGLLCGAGIASADAGSDPGTASSGARASVESPRAERGLARGSVPTLRPVSSPPRRTPGARAASAKPVIAVPVPGRSTLIASGIASAPGAAASIPAAALPARVVPAPAAAARRVTDAGNSGGSGASVLGGTGITSPAAARTAPQAVAQPVPVVPSSVPVDPAEFAGTYYEQGSVKQFFSLGLVNTKAEYTLNPDGTIRVQNSGNYFFNRGPRSSIVGSAVVVNDTNTALNVGFSPFSPPSASPPGNYTILANAPDYSWVIVSDPSGRSGYILTRDKTISRTEYRRLLDQARALGVQGRITPTKQYA
jgi:lipocalin